MNLALRDIRHKLTRFLLTAVGIGLLLMIVMGMSGIYRGLIEEALIFLDKSEADLWVVQKGTRGPFAEISRVPRSLEDRVQAVPGVAKARAFVSHTIQREYQGKSLRIAVQGLSWPKDRGTWLPLTAGRALGQAHYEMVADARLGMRLGDRITLGKNIYSVVGLTANMVSQSGDGMAFFTVADALDIQFDSVGEALRLERQSRRTRTEATDVGQTQPALLDRAKGPAAAIPVLGSPSVSAVMVNVAQGVNPQEVARTISSWHDVSVYSNESQCELMLKGIERNRKQLGMFRVLLIIISSIIMALILYTLTLDKIHDIAVLKLMGSRNRVIVGLILEQALLLGLLGYGIAYYLGTWMFPLFPRRVILFGEDLIQLALIVVAISVVSSMLGIWKAMSVQPNEVLS